MTGARTGTLARLRDRIARIEAGRDGGTPGRAALGHDEADAVLQGGLARGAVHEVFAEGRHSAAATGFIAGLAQRVGKDRPLLCGRILPRANPVRCRCAAGANSVSIRAGW